MEEITKILKKIQDDIDSQNNAMLEMQKKITEDVNRNTNEHFKEINIKYSEMAETLQKQNKDIEYLDKIIRRKNLVFFGVLEKEKDYFQLITIIRNIINEEMNIACTDSEIEFVRRIGRRNDNEKPRPIIVTLVTVGKKIEILKNKKSLERTPYYIKEDFSQKILEKRKSLQPELQKLREEGKQAIIRYDKIVILENRKTMYSKKRHLSPSPEAQKSYSLPIENTQQSKKTKSNISSFFSAKTTKSHLQTAEIPNTSQINNNTRI